MIWTPLTEQIPPPGKPVLVTNNINARSGNGYMSHVWLTHMVHEHKSLDPNYPSDHTAFAHPYWTEVENLSHWAPVEPPEGARHDQ